jgi:hypothetical protein
VLAVAGAALMAISPFPDWYHLDDGDTSFDVSGWDAFEMVDILLVGAAIAALVTLVRANRQTSIAERRLMALGAIAAAIVVVQLIDETPLIGFAGGFDISLRIGGWLALAGALLVFAAGAVTAASRS